MVRSNNSFIKNVSITVVAGLLLTFVLFLFNDVILPRKLLTGEWEIKVVIQESSSLELKNLKIFYKMHLVQNGYDLKGSGEKIKEINPNGDTLIYQRKDRVVFELEGYYDRRFIGRDNVFLVFREYGHLRESRSFYVLKIRGTDLLDGTFSSTAADATGIATLEKLF